jgi:hypothetical protein
MTNYCCEEGRLNITYDADDKNPCLPLGMDDEPLEPINFCPFCGKKLRL